MANETPVKVPKWTAADLLDLDAMLAADEEVDPSTLQERDRGIAEKDIAPCLPDALSPDASTADRSRVFRLWLDARGGSQDEKKEAHQLTPGEAFAHSRWLVGILLGLFSLLAGVALVMSILHREQRYFHVVQFLAATLLPQFALLVLLAGGWLLRGRRPEKAVGFFQALTRRAIEVLSEKALVRKVGDTATRSWHALRRRPYLGWQVAAVTQTAAKMFNIGILLAFGWCLAVMDLRFFWESTLAAATASFLKSVVDVLALPWSWLLAESVPTLADIEATRTLGVNEFTERTDSAKVWAQFLFLSVAVWGWLPRAILGLVIDWKEARAVKRFPFNDRPHRELWRRLTEVRLETPVAGQRDDTVVLLWGGTDPDSDTLRTALLQQARWNPVVTLAVGGLDIEEDQRAVEATVEKLRAADRPLRIALIADSWGLVPRDLEPFLRQLRSAIGAEVTILCFLLGAPKSGQETALAAPSEEEVKIWEQFAAQVDDPHLRIQPCRSAAAS